MQCINYKVVGLILLLGKFVFEKKFSFKFTWGQAFQMEDAAVEPALVGFFCLFFLEKNLVQLNICFFPFACQLISK